MTNMNKLTYLLIALIAVQCLPIGIMIGSLTEKRKTEPCQTDEFYRQAFIEVYNQGDSFSFYDHEGNEYTFTPKYE